MLEPWLYPTFSEFSYGFSPKRSVHQALYQAARYVIEGHRIVMDLDLEQFFDRVNHDVVMARLARHVGGGAACWGLIRRFLQAGMFSQGMCIERGNGTPQGGPRSPLLANLLLNVWTRNWSNVGTASAGMPTTVTFMCGRWWLAGRVKCSVTWFF